MWHRWHIIYFCIWGGLDSGMSTFMRLLLQPSQSLPLLCEHFHSAHLKAKSRTGFDLSFISVMVHWFPPKHAAANPAPEYTELALQTTFSSLSCVKNVSLRLIRLFFERGACLRAVISSVVVFFRWLLGRPQSEGIKNLMRWIFKFRRVQTFTTKKLAEHRRLAPWMLSFWPHKVSQFSSNIAASQPAKIP